MYAPQKTAITDIQTMHELIDRYSFALLVSASLNATQLAFVLDQSEGELGTLYSHFAKGNPHWKELEGSEVLVVFNGPHAYISPTSYARQPAVSTWNYVSVHARGKLTLVDAQTTAGIIDKTVDHHEPQLRATTDSKTEKYIGQLMAAVVGIKIEITSLQGKQKLGQHRSSADQRGVLHWLESSPELAPQELAQYMRHVRLGTGEED